MTCAESRRLHGQEKFNRASRFISEIPDELVSEIRMPSRISRPLSVQKSHYSQNRWQPEKGSLIPETNLSLGQRVSHTVFGEGIITGYEGRGNNARIEVNFDREGSKWLIFSYARLKIL